MKLMEKMLGKKAQGEVRENWRGGLGEMFAPRVPNIWISIESPGSLHGGSYGDRVTYGEDHHWSISGRQPEERS